MARRPNGDGSLYRLKNGKWQAAITVAGKRKTRTRISRKEARDALKELQHEAGLNSGISQSPTVEEFSRQWQRENETRKLAPNTLQFYDNMLKKINQHVGHIETSKLRPVDVQAMVNQMVSDEVGTVTVIEASKTLHTLMKRAVQLEMATNNPCANVRRPKRKKPQVEAFTIEEAKAIIAYGEQKKYPGLWKLAFQTGMRISELFGLHWSEVDFEANEVRVIQQLTYGRYRGLRPPKSESGVRTITVSDEVLEALNQQRRQNLRSGNGKAPHVFAGPQGGFVWVNTFYKCHWVPMLEKLEIPHRGFHSIRHTYATFAISEGVPITTVSHVLGHSDPSITLSKYAHAVPEDQAKAAETMRRLFA